MAASPCGNSHPIVLKRLHIAAVAPCEWEPDWWKSGGSEWEPDWWKSGTSDAGSVRTSATADTLPWSSAPASRDGPRRGGKGKTVAVDSANKPEMACGKCGTFVEPLDKGVRLMRKSPPVYMCRVCNNRTSSLTSFFANWPLDAFKSLSEAEQQQFWRDVGSAVGGDAIKRVVETQIFVKEARRDINAARGEFQPIAYWERLGYDGASIMRACQSEWNSDLGAMCYRVRIHHEDTEVVHEKAKQKMLMALQRGSKGGKRSREDPEVEPETTEPVELPPEVEPATTEPVELPPDVDPSSQSSTTTTTSEEDPNPQKKDKKNKKEDPKKARND